MLLSEPEIALDEALVACKESAHRYGYLLSILQDARLLPLLEKLATQRSENATILESLIRELGYLPRVSDPDKEALEKLISRFKSLLAEDAQTTLLAEQLSLEEQLVDKLEKALEQPLSSACLARLHEIKHAVSEAKAELNALLDR